MNIMKAIMVAAIGSALVVGSLATISATQLPKRRRAPAGQGKPQQQFWVPSTRPEPRTTERLIPPLVELRAMMNDPAKTYTIEPVRVQGNVKPRTQEEEKLFQEAAGALRRVRPVPAARLQFFSWLNQLNSPLTLYGWDVSVRQVTPTPAGWLVTVWGSPKAFKGGSAAVVYNIIAEEYLWANGNVQFVRAYPLTGAEPSFGW